MIHFLKTAFFPIVLLALLLPGCSSTPDNITTPLAKQTSKQRIAKLQQLKQWQIKGKIAFIEKNNRNSASLTWQADESKGNQKLNLTSYLGINVLVLNSKNNHHTLQVDGKKYQGEDLTALIYSLTGLTLPTQALSYWLKGMKYQADDIVTYQDKTQLPQVLISHYNNELWQVNYGNYQQIEDFSLATKFTIKKDDLLIKIAINEWSVNKPNNYSK